MARESDPIAVLQFFSDAVLAYSCGDLQEMFDIGFRPAGPMLAVVVNGIDLVGGILQGFDSPSNERSIAFMTKYMDLDLDIARMLYGVVRCGVSHQGLPKLRVMYFTSYTLPKPKLLYRGEDSILLDVTEFARQYITATHMLALEGANNLRFLPAESPRDQRSLEVALDKVTVWDQELFDQLSEEEVGEIVPSGAPDVIAAFVNTHPKLAAFVTERLPPAQN